MKLQGTLNSRPSGPLPFVATWNSDGWKLDLRHHSCMVLEDGSEPDAPTHHDLSRLFTNEGIDWPASTPSILRTLWDDIKASKVSESAAQARFTSLCDWISATTQAYPGDKKIYYTYHD